jgi:hypothetical protein
MTRRCNLISHSCKPLVTAPLTWAENPRPGRPGNARLGVGGKKDAKGFQPGVLDLILQIRGDLHLRLVDGGVLQARDLNPRIHLLDVKREVPRRTCNTRNASTPFCRMPDFCGSNCVYAFARRDLQAHPLFRHDQQRAAAACRPRAARFAAPSSLARLHARPGQG